jgi:hypothetical protein
MAHSISENSSCGFQFCPADSRVPLRTYKTNLIQDIEDHSALFRLDLSDVIEAIRISPQAPRQLTIRSKENSYQIRLEADRSGKIRSYEFIKYSNGSENPGILKRVANAVVSAIKAAFEAIAFFVSLPFLVISAVVKATVEIVQAAVITAIALPVFLASAVVMAPAIIALSIATSIVALPIIGVGTILAAPVIIPVVILGSILLETVLFID